MTQHPYRRRPKHYEFLREKLDSYLDTEDPPIDLVYPLATVGTISDYLRLREKPGYEDFPAYALIYDPFEWIMLLDDATALGVTERDFHRALSGDGTSIDAVCIHLLKLIKDFESVPDKSHPIRRGKAKSDAMINFLTGAMNEACAQRGLIPPASLIFLTSKRLCGSNPAAKAKASLYQMISDAGEYFAGIEPDVDEEGGPTVRGLAKAIGVAPSTVTRQLPALARAKELWDLAENPPEEWVEPDIPMSPDYPKKA